MHISVLLISFVIELLPMPMPISYNICEIVCVCSFPT